MSDQTDLTLDVMAADLPEDVLVQCLKAVDPLNGLVDWQPSLGYDGVTRDHIREIATILFRLADATPGAAPGEGVASEDEAQRAHEYETWVGLVEMLKRDHERMRRSGTALAEAALYTIGERDGLHRLSLAVSDWAKAVADEGDRARLASPSPARSDRAAEGWGDGFDVVALAQKMYEARPRMIWSPEKRPMHWDEVSVDVHKEFLTDAATALATVPTPAPEGVDLRPSLTVAADIVSKMAGEHQTGTAVQGILRAAQRLRDRARFDPQADKVDALRVAADGYPIDEHTPRDCKILAWCDHEADPYEDRTTTDGRSRLTLYAAHAEGLSHAETGFHIIEWGGGFADSPEDGGSEMPDWWFVAGSEFEVAANPIRWWPLPNAPRDGGA